MLPCRAQLETQLARVFESLFATVSTPGELGTVANWNQHLLPNMFARLESQLRDIERGGLAATNDPPVAPATAGLFASDQARQPYRGPARVIVPTLRSSMSPGERLNLKVIILSEHPPREAKLFVRPLGRGEFVGADLKHVARGVYRAQITPPADALDFEYYVRVRSADGAPTHFPASAPKLNQTVVVLPAMPADK